MRGTKLLTLTLGVMVGLLALSGCGSSSTGKKCAADGSTCGAHGTCDDSQGSAECTCEAGWTGEACAACADGYQDYGDGNCLPSDPCAAADCAAQHRDCANQSGQAVCGDCLSGFHAEGTDCVLDAACGADSCSGHGACDDAGGVIQCTCDAGYAGLTCALCAPGYQDYGDGSCLPVDPCAAADCSDQGRVCTNEGGAAVCGDCLPGHHDDNGACVADTSCLPGTCSGHGACDDSAGQVSCVCQSGYAGAFCETCAPGFMDYGDGQCLPADPCVEADCADQGRLCTNEGGVAVCGDCLPGFHDEGGACVPDTTCLPTSCNDHGSCDDSGPAVVCTCESPYTGTACADCEAGFASYDGVCLPADPCAEDDACAAALRECLNDQGQAVCGDCLPGHHEEAGACVPDSECLSDTCSGHGDCTLSAGAVACACFEGYAGPFCSACAAGFVTWPAGGDTCLKDPCQPDPCAIAHALPDGCVQTGPGAFLCQCEAGYAYNGAACVGTCQDQDGDGFGDGPGCQGTDCDDADPVVYEGAAELCDGKNNDCDDSTDEDFADLGLACDGADGDLCPNGTWICTADGAGLECTNETITDIIDLCDGLDNDCDGLTDGPYAAGGDAPYDGGPYPGDAGKFLGEACGAGLCEGGLIQCTQDGLRLTCSSLNQIAPELCDAVDNDCDGQTDDPYAVGGDMPFDGGPYAADAGKFLGEDCGTGACVGGQVVCAQDGAGLSCSNGALVGPETCDGEDDDCNGTVDDPFMTGGDQPFDGGAFVGDAGKFKGDPCGTGACVGGQVECDLDGSGLVCSNGILASAELCDDQDNDCDGETDDPFIAGGDTPYDGGPFAGDAGKFKGVACGTGLCVDGEVVCTADLAGLTCSSLDQIEPETCDNVDQDCDGAVDESFPELGAPCDTGNLGICAAGTWACVDGALQCQQNEQPVYEICGNAFDDNCDGLADENIDADGDGWGHCDGDCCDLVGACSATPELVNPGAMEALNNGIDDDCNAATSDTVPAPACATSVKWTGVTGSDVARAMGLCQFTTANPPPLLKIWGVISAQQVFANGAPPNATQLANIQNWQSAVLANYGTVVTPQNNPTMAGLSTGRMRDTNDPGFVAPQVGTDFGVASVPPAAYLAAHGGQLPSSAGCNGACPSGSGAYDPVNVRLSIRVPTNAISFSFRYRFFTSEYPESACTPYNDFFLALLQSGASGIPADGNIAFDVVNNPVSMNNAFFEVCAPAGCNTCPFGTAALAGTGMDGNVGGGTQWLQVDAPVVPGETIVLQLMTFDVSDGAMDTLVLLDDFQWALDPALPGS